MKNQPTQSITSKHILLAVVFTLALSACGNKGDLYLPKEPETTQEQQDSKP